MNSMIALTNEVDLRRWLLILGVLLILGSKFERKEALTKDSQVLKVESKEENIKTGIEFEENKKSSPLEQQKVKGKPLSFFDQQNNKYVEAQKSQALKIEFIQQELKETILKQKNLVELNFYELYLLESEERNKIDLKKLEIKRKTLLALEQQKRELREQKWIEVDLALQQISVQEKKVIRLEQLKVTFEQEQKYLEVEQVSFKQQNQVKLAIEEVSLELEKANFQLEQGDLKKLERLLLEVEKANLEFEKVESELILLNFERQSIEEYGLHEVDSKRQEMSEFELGKVEAELFMINFKLEE